MSDQSVPQKLCKRCGVEKPATEEYFKTSRHGNLSSPCRDCYREIKAEWRANNPDKVKKHKKESHERNRDKDNARTKKWADENRERVQELNRQYRLDHLEERRAYEAQWQRDNPDKVKARNKRYAERHPEKVRNSRRLTKQKYAHSPHGRLIIKTRRERNRDKTNSQHRYRYAHVPGVKEKHLAKAHNRRMADGHFTPSDIRALYDEQEGRCAYCGISTHDDYHVDHLVPLKRGGTHDPENLRISCPTCNMSKGAKLLSEWEAVRGW